MTGIKLICVGRLKEAHYIRACDELLQRLGRYCRIDVIEVDDEKSPEKLSAAQREQVRQREGRAVLSKLCEGEYFIATDIGGVQLDSMSFAQRLDKLAAHGESRIAIAVGGSLGLSAEVLDRAALRLSFSPMTFNHRLFRLMLLEQLYRAHRINRGEPYHK
ncbi:MAG: 23S rRNA (pseudouridine(1915)-N(3))-methyltransferase RlmH [Clostridia bacterium]|nr:23S rRNA (pseudouridine(1915)-N(3))-methyltransferase RlmH [Clostridia bacterium]